MKIKVKLTLILMALSLISCDGILNELNNGLTDMTETKETCRNLHKVTNVDDLLKQMYDNIDSYCLFDMPTEELESIWGIKVFDFTNLVEKVSDSELKAMTEEEYNEYKQSFRDLKEQYLDYVKTGGGLLVTKELGGSGEYFSIQPTDAYRHQVKRFLGGSLDDGKFPKGFPTPKTYTLPKHSYSLPNASPDDKPVIVPENTVYKRMTYYWWVNHDNDINKPFLEILTSPYPVPSSPLFYKRGNNHSESQHIFN